MRSVILILIVAASVSACGKRGLMDLRTNSDGPDEFMILPSKPLTIPQNLAALPAPTPGAANLVDRSPKQEAVAALGGRASAGEGIPASDGALVTHSSRHGVASDVRETLADEDAKFRKRQAFLTRLRLFRVDRYRQAYRRQVIDPYPETNLYRRSGLQTPASPPRRR